MYATSEYIPMRQAGHRYDFEEMAGLGEATQGDCLGRDWAGLFLRSFSSRRAETGFLRQLELAQAAKLPIVIHCRPSDGSENAWEDCLRLAARTLGGERAGRHSALFYWNVGSCEAGARYGIHDFFRRKRDFSQSATIRDAAKEVPLERMLIETDSPYLAPAPNRGKRNEPAFVKETARQLGELRGLSAEKIGAQTTQNFFEFFSLHEKADSI